MTPREILVKARALIEKPENWTRRAAARREMGIDCSPVSHEAKCFCMVGAVANVTREELWIAKESEPAVERLLNKVCGRGGIARFNDSHDHKDILAAFDRAIALTES